MTDGFTQGVKKGAGISFGCLIGVIAGFMLFFIAMMLMCSSRIATERRDNNAAVNNLNGEIIKSEQRGEYATFKVKIANVGKAPVGQTQMTLVLFGADGKELDAVDHYCLSIYDPPLEPGSSRYKDYTFENVSVSSVKSYKCIFH